MSETTATCCDKDKLCYGDLTDRWCCDKKFYCTTTSPELAKKDGGILCPFNPETYDKQLWGVVLAIILVFVVLGCFLLWGIFCSKKKLKPTPEVPKDEKVDYDNLRDVDSVDHGPRNDRRCELPDVAGFAKGVLDKFS